MSYIYHFRQKPDLTRPLPKGCVSLLVRRKAEYEYRLQCSTFGSVSYDRQLTTEELAEHGLVNDPANYLPWVRKG